ncbi:MAG: hypothetical protein R2817_06850 [Flavobacteriales bacterium]
MRHEGSTDELNDAPMLSGLRGKASFTVPPGADEALRKRVMERIAHEPTAQARIIPFRIAAVLLPLAAAAMLGGVLFLVLRPDPVNTTPASVAERPFEDPDLEWLLDAEEIHTLYAEQPDLMPLAEDLSEDALIDHLAHNELPLDLLLEELPLQ